MGRKRIWNNDAERMAATRAAKKATDDAAETARAYALTDAETRGVLKTIERECCNYDTVACKCISGGNYQTCYAIGTDGGIHCSYFFNHVLPYARQHRDTETLAENITARYLQR